ncbi:MAG: hypothetical protein CMO20_00785 [Thermoplasmata archaeon]|nr:hypothetical protein [Thermoplasmata archaeon]
MAMKPADLFARMNTHQFRRGATLFAFYVVLALLLVTLLGSFVNPTDSQLSAYDNDWDDISKFRSDLNSMGVDTHSLVSSPLLLHEIKNPEETVFIIAGVEKDTISLPRFTGDENVIQMKENDGYTTSEVEAITSFVARGGTIIVMDDFGYSSGVAEAFGIEYSGHKLYDAGAWTLDYNYIWINSSDSYKYTSNISNSWNHPCFRDSDGDGFVDLIDPDPTHPGVPGTMAISAEQAGLCAHHITGNGATPWDFDPGYDLLLNSPSAFDPENSDDEEKNRYGLGFSSTDSYLDINDDGDLTVGPAGSGFEGDMQGPFTVYIKYCLSRNCEDKTAGKAHFISDGSLLINSVYDYENLYGSQETSIDQNDNRKWALDAIAEAILYDENGTLSGGENAQVIFDESLHQQTSFMGDTYNLIYYLLVYFTSDWMAMLLLFLTLFIAFEAVIIRKTDPEPWRHVFSIIYYGFGDSRRYGYYSRANKVKQVLLSRVRNLNTLTRDEFDALPARELQKMINDPVLVKFVFEDRNYSLEQLVAVVKRIKMWGRK